MNKDNAHLFLPFVQALMAGKTIEYHDGNGWETMTDLSFYNRPEDYRIKAVKVVKWGVLALWANSQIPVAMQTLYNTEDEAASFKASFTEKWPGAKFTVVEISWEE